MDINHIKSSLKSILPEEYSKAVLSWLEALQEWSDDELVTITNHPVQLNEISGDSGMNSLTVDASENRLVPKSQCGQPIPTIGPYEDLGFLGKGGMGEVRLVRDRKLNRRLAMKILHPHLLSRRISTSRFIEEAQVCAQLEHPNIVPIHDFGTLSDGRLYFTMKEIKGRSLDSIIWSVHNAVRDGKFQPTQDGWSFRRLIDVFHQVCFAVGYAHSKGVLHRDLKPSNIMIGEFGEVLVVDWGIAKVLGREDLLVCDQGKHIIQSSKSGDMLTQIGQVVGTPTFMAPEQARGENDKLAPETDVYALGAILYKILSGQLAYPGNRASEILEKVKSSPPKTIFKVLDGETSNAVEYSNLPQELVRACEKAMSRNMNDRFQTAKELGNVILDWLEGAKKKEEAMNIFNKTLPMRNQISRLLSESQALFGCANTGLKSLPDWEDESVKSQFWKQELQAKQMTLEAERLDLKVEQLLQAALTHKSDLVIAHEALIHRYMEEHKEAEFVDDHKAIAYSELHLRHHAFELPVLNQVRQKAIHYLKGTGALSIRTEGDGVEIFLDKFEPFHRRLVPKRMAFLGHDDVNNLPLEMGSYRLILKKIGCREVTYPFEIGRGEHWDCIDPNGLQRIVRIPRIGELSPNDCFIPAGWFWCGKEKGQTNSLKRKRIWLDDFVIEKFQVTNKDYLEFLNDLLATGREDDAMNMVIRENKGHSSEVGSIIYGRDKSGRFCIVPDSEGDIWGLDWPIMMVTFTQAQAFVKWKSETTGRQYRLPTEVEWEKAARGVDGREFVWGNEFDASYCCMFTSHKGRRLPVGINTFPIDESVYGVRGMAGGQRDWTNSSWRKSWDSEPDENFNVIRGGCWFDPKPVTMTTFRTNYSPIKKDVNTSFRLMRPYS